MPLICKDEMREKDQQYQITASEIMKSSVFARTCEFKSHPSNTQRYVRHGLDLKWKSQGFACLSRAIWNLQLGVKLSHPPLINFFFLHQLFIWLCMKSGSGSMTSWNKMQRNKIIFCLLIIFVPYLIVRGFPFSQSLYWSHKQPLVYDIKKFFDQIE